ncbi:carbamoyltransferase HypF [Vibrio sp. MA40-2]|uniref:carbamoyltransferase HypF n=1 Tax=Vibrio sp. MA40-2 TaxID=3391828 RepID=UPI0039A44971
MLIKGIELRVKGKVQGVGFRPFVWQLAEQLSLKGHVLNDGQGVLICLLQHPNIEQFKQKLYCELPPLAQIETLLEREIIWQTLPNHFSINQSSTTNIDTQVVPDAATCPECLAELFSTHDHRYHYPFINCTHCGPRFTIIKQMPYDRPKTVMADFPLCPTCHHQYISPSNRRYHAQPIACPACGPQIQVVSADGRTLQNKSKFTERAKLINGAQLTDETNDSENWLTLAIQALKHGKIIAIKSVGGFHLACDATNQHAIATLRNRKHRQYKPLAVMVSNICSAHSFAYIDQHEKKALQSHTAPIVLLKKKNVLLKKKKGSILAQNIAPQLNEIGLMLPSNPIQHLLCRYFNKPLVMTSANKSGLPPVLDNQQALNTLNGIADLFILHNRDITQRCDDSLIRINKQGQQETLRRSRGLVPNAITLPSDFPNADGYLAYGGDLKNAFAIGKSKKIIVSQYLGDLTNIETQQQYKQAIEHFISLYQSKPIHHIADLHPGYFSHQYALAQQGHHHLVQHHHAHVASCLVENKWAAKDGKVLALAMDGLGFSEDGTIWGAELLLADYQHSQQIGGLPAINLLGGDKAVKEPWRSLYAHLKAFYPTFNFAELTTTNSLSQNHSLKQNFASKPLLLLTKAMQRNINSHQVRSAGRLFDAVAASLNIAFDHSEYEGLSACQLEALAQNCTNKTNIKPIKIGHRQLEIDLTEFWPKFITNTNTRADKAYLFHLSFATALANLVIAAKEQYHSHNISHLVLTGGVFHNALLTQLLTKALNDKISILQHSQFSCGDGGLALGQLAIALLKHNSKQ